MLAFQRKRLSPRTPGFPMLHLFFTDINPALAARNLPDRQLGPELRIVDKAARAVLTRKSIRDTRIPVGSKLDHDTELVRWICRSHENMRWFSEYGTHVHQEYIDRHLSNAAGHPTLTTFQNCQEYLDDPSRLGVSLSTPLAFPNLCQTPYALYVLCNSYRMELAHASLAHQEIWSLPSDCPTWWDEYLHAVEVWFK